MEIDLKKTSLFVVIFLGLLLQSCCYKSCMKKTDSLDAVKPFKSEDKYFKAGLRGLHFIIETSAIPKVDSVFTQMVDHFGLPVDATGCPDGTYTGQSPPDAYDYAHWVKLKIENEKIVWIDYNEIKPDGKGKQEDKAYCEEMNAAGTNPSIAYPHMEKEMLEEQTIMTIDGVSGASYSRYRFRYAVTVALMKARLKKS